MGVGGADRCVVGASVGARSVGTRTGRRDLHARRVSVAAQKDFSESVVGVGRSADDGRAHLEWDERSLVLGAHDYAADSEKSRLASLCEAAISVHHRYVAALWPYRSRHGRDLLTAHGRSQRQFVV